VWYDGGMGAGKRKTFWERLEGGTAVTCLIGASGLLFGKIAAGIFCLVVAAPFGLDFLRRMRRAYGWTSGRFGILVGVWLALLSCMGLAGWHRSGPSDRATPSAAGHQKAAIPSPGPVGRQAEGPRLSSPPIIQKNVTGDNILNQGSGDITINKKSDPNAWSVRYAPDGTKWEAKGGTHKAPDHVLVPIGRQIQALYRAEKWPELVELCEKQVKAIPDWLTPYFFAAIGYGSLGDYRKGIERLEHFQAGAKEDPDYANLYAQTDRIMKQLRDADQ